MTSRYAQTCPACGAVIRPADVHRRLTQATFDFIPSCGQELKIGSRYTAPIWTTCFLAGPTFSWLFGYEGWMFAIAAVSITLGLLVLGIFLVGVIIVPGYKQVQSLCLKKEGHLIGSSHYTWRKSMMVPKRQNHEHGGRVAQLFAARKGGSF